MHSSSCAAFFLVTLMCIYNDQHVEAQSIRFFNPKPKCNVWTAKGKTYKNCFFGTAATRSSTSTSTKTTGTPIFTIKSIGNNMCLDSNSAKKVYLSSCNGGNFQKWYRSGLSLKSVGSSYFLEGNFLGLVSMNTGNGRGYQNWQITDKGNYVTLVNDITNGFLGVDASDRVQTTLYGFNLEHKWTIILN